MTVDPFAIFFAWDDPVACNVDRCPVERCLTTDECVALAESDLLLIGEGADARVRCGYVEIPEIPDMVCIAV